MSSLSSWLVGLEDRQGAYLWPHTPIANIQAEIWQRCGASDWAMDAPGCRARAIVDTLREMLEQRLLPRPFFVLDLCCGDGVVILQIGRHLLDAECYGADLLRYPTHRLAETRGGCAFYKAPLQAIVAAPAPVPIDVAVMLNTFRGWDRACLPQADCDLPERTLAWLKHNCRYAFLTVRQEQEEELRAGGWFTIHVGRGEDASRLVLAFPCDNSGLWRPR